jgi:hypothetical protein
MKGIVQIHLCQAKNSFQKIACIAAFEHPPARPLKKKPQRAENQMPHLKNSVMQLKHSNTQAPKHPYTTR